MTCRTRLLPVVFWLMFSLFAGFGQLHAEPGPDAISQALRGRLEPAADSPVVWIGCEPVCAIKDLAEYYRGRDFRPLWVSPSGPSAAARELVSVLGDAERHGLFPHDYHFRSLSAWLGSTGVSSATW